MADIERFGGELYLDANNYIQTIGQVDRANKRFAESLVQTGNAVEQMGVKFQKGFVGAEKFGKLQDLGTGRIRRGMELLNEKLTQVTTKYSHLSESGRKAYRSLGDALSKLESVENKYRGTLEAVVTATIKAAKAGDDDREAKDRVNKSVRAAVDAHKVYKKAIVDVNQAQAKINRQNAAIIASYQMLGKRLAVATSGVSRLKSAWSRLIGGLGKVRGALSGITGSFGQAGSGAAAAGGAMAVLGKVAGGVGIALGAVASVVKLLGKAFSIAISPIKKVVNALKDFFKTASQVAVGILIRDSIRSLVREFRELALSGFQAVKFFQALEIRLDLMELRSLRAEGAVGSLSEIMTMAGDRAKKLTHWIKVLSLTSPFTVETLATVTSLNLAMGFTEDMSKRLTLAIANYTAGMGLSNQVMERIVFNFGQMKSAGKVTGTEMRDLARGAFLPLADVLDEAARLMGVVTDDIMEFRKAAAEGAVDVDTFFRAFINVVDRDFGEASDRFSRTLEGVRNRLNNFMKTILGLEVLGPVMARFSEIASNALDTIMTEEKMARARLLGQTIVRAFDQVYYTIKGRLVPAFQFLWKTLGFGTITFESIAFSVAKFSFYLQAAIKLVVRVLDKMIDYFYGTGDELVTQMGNFGKNIITVFANGMASALHLVVKVLTWIGNAISGLLGAHSAPKLLPDLPKWGMEAMTAYLEGFTLADFDILEGIQDPVKDALDILEQTGKIGANQAGKIYAEISKTIAKALSTGQIDEGLFAEIEKITGPFGEEIAELARRQIELAGATEDVRKAEQRLEDARKAHSASRVKTNKLIREYNKDLRAGADPSYLKAKLAEINASEEASRAAYEEQKAAESDLEQKERSLEILEDMLELQEKLVDQLLALTKAQIIQPEQPGAGAGDGEDIGDKEGIIPLPPLPEIELPDEEAIKKKIDDIFRAAREEVDRQMAELAKAWEGTGLGAAFTGLGESWRKAWESITTYYEETVKPILDRIKEWWTETGWPTLSDTFADFGDAISEVWGVITDTFDDINERLEELGLDGVGIEFEDVLNVILLVIRGFGIAIALAALIAGFIVTTLFGGFIQAAARVSEAWDTVEEAWEQIKEAWADLKEGFSWQGVLDLIGGLGLLIFGLVATIIAGIGGFFEGVWLSIVDFFNNLWDKLVGNSIIPEMMQDIWDAITQPLEDLAEWWNELWGSLTDWWDETLKPAIDDLVAKFVTMKDELITAYEEWRDAVLEKMRVFFAETLPEAWQKFKDKVAEVWSWIETNVITPIRNWIDNELTDLKEMFDTTLTNALSTFKENVLDPIAKGFDSVVTAASDLISWIGELAIAVRDFDIGALAALLGFSPSPLAIGIDTASAAMERMSRTAIPNLAKQVIGLQSAGILSPPVVNAPAVAGFGGSSQSVNVQMGGVNISNGMDEALFEARVLNIVQRGLRS